jgi:hypothetical protein
MLEFLHCCKTEGGDVSISVFLKMVEEMCEFPHFGRLEGGNA